MHVIDTLLKQVKIEATNLKAHATKEEIDLLGSYMIQADFHDACVYGQMTGSCYSARASELILLSAERVYNTPNTWFSIDTINNINGKPKLIENRTSVYFSPIELFHYVMETINGYLYVDMLVEYIKGVGEFNISAEHIRAIKDKYEYFVNSLNLLNNKK